MTGISDLDHNSIGGSVDYSVDVPPTSIARVISVAPPKPSASIEQESTMREPHAIVPVFEESAACIANQKGTLAYIEAGQFR